MLNKTPATRPNTEIHNRVCPVADEQLVVVFGYNILDGQLVLLDSPPMGAAKQQPTPTAQAAASISMFLDSF